MGRKFGFVFFVFIAAVWRSCYAEELTWEDCRLEALQMNPDLKYAEKSLEALKLDKKITTAGLLPQLNASASQSVSDSEGASSQKNTSYGIAGSIKLFDSMKTPYEVRAASKKVEAGEFAYQIAGSDILLSLRSAFVNLIDAQETVKLTETIMKRKRENVKLVSLRYKGGREHKGALLTAEADLAESEYSLKEAVRGLSLARQNVLAVIGGRENKEFYIEGELVLSGDYSNTPDFDLLVKDIPFIKQLALLREEAGYNKKSLVAGNLPDFSASASYRNSGNSWNDLSESYSAGVSVSMPIFTGGANTYRINKSHIAYLQSEYRQVSAVNEMRSNLETQWKRLIDAKETVEVKKKFLEAYEERAKIASSQYSMGLMGFDDWIIIENNLASAQKAYLAARANMLISEAGWIHSLGGTLNEKIY